MARARRVLALGHRAANITSPGKLRLGKVVVLLILAWSLAGCSVKFVYSNMDRLVRWQVSDYLELDAEQKDYLQLKITELLDWHRTTHMPVYAQYLYGLSTQMSDGVTEQQIATIAQQMLLWGEEIETHGLPAATHLLASLSDEQVAALPARLEKSNADIAEAEIGVSVEDIQADWAEDFESVIERFTGRLQRNQRAYISRRAGAYQPERVLSAEYRRRWQADLLRLLEKRADVEKFTAGFRQLVASRDSYYGAAYKQASEDNIRLSRQLASYLLSNLTDKQSERFADVLTGWAEDFEALAAQA